MMSLSTILMVIGLLATVLLGVLGLYIMTRRKYQGQVTFVRESCIGLFGSIVKNMSELAVQYKGTPVAQGLVLIKGSFLNTGAKDISDVMVEEDIAISLPDKFKWLTAKIISASPKVQANVNVTEKAISFDIGLFRRKEYIRFEALAEVDTEDSPDRKEEESIEKRLINSLSITHRIADTQKIKKKDLSLSDYTRKRLKRRFIPLGITIFLGIVFFVGFYFLGFPAKLHFIVPVESGNTIEVKVIARSDGTLRIKGVDDKSYRKTVSPENFFGASNIMAKVVPDKKAKFIMVLAPLLYIIAPLIFAGFIYREYKQAKKLLLLLGISE